MLNSSSTFIEISSSSLLMVVPLARIAIGDICAELEQASDVIKAHGGSEDAHETLFRSWCTKLNTDFADCLAADTRKLTASINLGPWTDAQKDDLVDIITKPKSATQKTKRRRGQTCLHFENFVPAAALVKLKDTERYSQNSRLSIIASVAKSLNLINPGEKTRFHMIKLLAHCEDNWEYEQTQVHKLMDKVREFIQCGRVKKDLPYLEVFPLSADDLPRDLKIHAYGSESDLPLIVHMPHLDGVLNGRKQRGRDKADNMAWMQHVPEKFRHQVMGSISRPSPTSAPPSSHAAIGASLGMPSAEMFRYGVPLKQEGGRYVKPEPKGDTPMISPKVENDSDHEDSLSDPDEQAADKTVGDMEHAMVAAYNKAKKIMKRPGAAVPVKKEQTMKRPSGAPTLKRPACAGKIDLTHIFAKLRARRPIGNLNSLTSGA